MTEESLSSISLNDLFDLMVKTMNELLAIEKVPQNREAINDKQKEVELLQRVIVARKSALPPESI